MAKEKKQTTVQALENNAAFELPRQLMKAVEITGGDRFQLEKQISRVELEQQIRNYMQNQLEMTPDAISKKAAKLSNVVIQYSKALDAAEMLDKLELEAKSYEEELADLAEEDEDEKEAIEDDLALVRKQIEETTEKYTQDQQECSDILDSDPDIRPLTEEDRQFLENMEFAEDSEEEMLQKLQDLLKDEITFSEFVEALKTDSTIVEDEQADQERSLEETVEWLDENAEEILQTAAEWKQIENEALAEETSDTASLDRLLSELANNPDESIEKDAQNAGGGPTSEIDAINQMEFYEGDEEDAQVGADNAEDVQFSSDDESPLPRQVQSWLRDSDRNSARDSKSRTSDEGLEQDNTEQESPKGPGQ